MRLIDTSAWVEWLTGSATARKLSGKIPARQDWLIPTIIQLELAKWLTREAGEDQADSVMAFTQTCVISDLTTRIALAAAGLSVQHKLATADAVIYATALAFDAELVTCDKHFAGLAGVTYVAKIRD